LSSISKKAPRPAVDLDRLCIDTVRTLSMDAVQKADSGHPGTPMALAPAAYVLWTRFLRYDPKEPLWPDRDRFVLSFGHASMLLYSVLHLTGYAVSLGDIEQFRQLGSSTPGHPERGMTPGVEVVPAYLANLNRILPKGEFVMVPLLSRVSFGPPLRLEEGERKPLFLERARKAVCSLENAR